MLVQNKGNYSYEANGLTLVPGTNKVNDKEFEKFLSHPLMAHLDKQGEFVYEGEQSKSSAKELIAMIEDAYDVDMLEALKAEESRTTVLDAIDKRIEELKNPEK
ncbi:hypothetical protein [Lysinibacillus piscis]|uniref:Uncharacterized protein n=1 Tax=Lysinibacillus piscis TaxID=2518931 RepID=A0ABQ5NJK4_9BACI|nr:hypothetical protein [Lysinibacillus sp. KH24]GLC88251.1 hypothetical protein LYSBPC_13780 [Lysinibacillus sp. KH24]